MIARVPNGYMAVGYLLFLQEQIKGIIIIIKRLGTLSQRLGTLTNKRHHHYHRVGEAFLDDRVREAAKWLQAAFDGAHNLQNCTWRTSLDAGQEDAALAHLKEHLSWRTEDGAAERYLRSAEQVARGFQRRCVA